MEPMTPMAPMAAMSSPERWWPDGLGEAAACGEQGGTRYAVFPDARRLLIERDGRVEAYDTGAHRIGGIAQGSGRGGSLVFSSQDGPVSLDTLAPAD